MIKRPKPASGERWRRITDAKLGPCRVCEDPADNGSVHGSIELTYLVKPEHGGEDTEDNIVPMCPQCAAQIRLRWQLACLVLLSSLTDAEARYMRHRGGSDYPLRRFGVPYER